MRTYGNNQWWASPDPCTRAYWRTEEWHETGGLLLQEREQYQADLAMLTGRPVKCTLTPEEVSVVDAQGTPVLGDLAPSSELLLHLKIYERLGAGAIVHTHAPMATALACVLDELPMIHYQMVACGGPVRVTPLAPFGSTELAEVKLLEGGGGSGAGLLPPTGAPRGPAPIPFPNTGGRGAPAGSTLRRSSARSS